MNRIALAVLISLAACGGGSKSTIPNTPIPPDPAVAAGSDLDKPAPPAPPPAPPAPPAPPPPLDQTIAAVDNTLKVIRPGAGKKSVLKLVGAKDAKQHVSIALDIADRQVVVGEGSADEVAPTLVLGADVAVTDIGSDGTTSFVLTVTDVDTRDRAGAPAKPSAADLKAQVSGIIGLTIGGAVHADGQVGDLKLHLDHSDPPTRGALELVKVMLAPLWPVLPPTAIGAGAKWTVASPYKIANQIDATRSVDYELVSHKNAGWEIKGKIAVSAPDRTVSAKMKIEKVAATGTISMTLDDGKFVPASAQTLTSDFTMAQLMPDPKGGPTSASVHLDQSFTLTPQ